ncbi:uncharacterized protein (UPF0276 family) [Hydrogenophaga palleronii]|uniref:UPF0276 protein J2W49_004667 n=1 Tax=Hydrogenophaga palleronii TaxID=65655 RepID=A0ABU1WTR6_9BURK|nr:DUF692 family multinuclear iron-containing protein [Hydrogenophaga palleronii]MDR7152689.1 uncharacterized protein (UPF0276 family) [Hydrogenophaga palleronii]
MRADSHTAEDPSRNTQQTGFGLGLRTVHYADFLREKQPVDWLEIISDNFLVDGGKPLAVLDQIRRDYPVAMHGVAMSIGGTDPLNREYLRKVKALADRIDPLWISDHLCWSGHYHHRLHDLYPLPYTEEAARHLIDRIGQVQDVLGRRLVMENVSSYIDYEASASTEWEFLRHVSQQADCLLLVDVNNIYVSGTNHGFDPLTYLQALPAGRVQQIHLAGHTRHPHCLVDTHDQPVCPEVWQLYAQACALFGPVATMIERDDNIPALGELLGELDIARQIRRDAFVGAGRVDAASGTAPAQQEPLHERPSLHSTQETLTRYILGPTPSDPLAHALIRPSDAVQAGPRLEIYHHAYRARLVEALADTFSRTAHYVGTDAFAQWARDFATTHPPTCTSLNRYGDVFADFLRARFPHNAELHELAQLDWDLRSRFDMQDVPALYAADAAALSAEHWLNMSEPLHPTVLLRTVQTNVLAIWKALQADEAVPAAHPLEQAAGLVVWRSDHQPSFQSIDKEQMAFMSALSEDSSLARATEQIQAQLPQLTAQRLSGWIQDALGQGWLRSPAA